MIRRVAHGKALPAAVVAQVVAEDRWGAAVCGGVDHMVLESGLIQEREGATTTGPLPRWRFRPRCTTP